MVAGVTAGLAESNGSLPQGSVYFFLGHRESRRWDSKRAILCQDAGTADARTNPAWERRLQTHVVRYKAL